MDGPPRGGRPVPGPAMFDPNDGRLSRPKGSRRNVRARKRKPLIDHGSSAGRDHAGRT